MRMSPCKLRSEVVHDAGTVVSRKQNCKSPLVRRLDPFTPSVIFPTEWLMTCGRQLYRWKRVISEAEQRRSNNNNTRLDFVKGNTCTAENKQKYVGALW